MHVTDIQNQNTFLCSNGGSTIDITVMTINTVPLVSYQYVDETVELLTGAPMRGHIPVWTEFILRQNRSDKKTIFAWSKADWIGHSTELENMSHTMTPILSLETDPIEIWNKIHRTLLHCRDKFVQQMVLSGHSKPYWTPKLSEASKKLREMRKLFKFRSPYENGDKLEEAKQYFKEALDEARNNFLKQKTDPLNEGNNEQYRRKFKDTFYKPKKCQIGDLKSNNTLITSDAQKSQLLYEDIFQGKHMDQTTCR